MTNQELKVGPTTSVQILSSKDASSFKTMMVIYILFILELYNNKSYKKALKIADTILTKNPNHGETLSIKALLLLSLSHTNNTTTNTTHDRSHETTGKRTNEKKNEKSNESTKNSSHEKSNETRKIVTNEKSHERTNEKTNEEKDMSEIIEIAKRGLRNGINSYICWYSLGMIYRNMRRYKDTIKCYIMAYKLDMKNERLLREICSLEIEINDYSGFRKYASIQLKLKPKEYREWLIFAFSQHLCGNLKLAIEILEEADKLFTHNNIDELELSESIMYHAMLYEHLHEYIKCSSLLQLKSHLVKDQLTFLELKAKADFFSNNIKSANEIYKKLIHLYPSNCKFLFLYFLTHTNINIRKLFTINIEYIQKDIRLRYGDWSTATNSTNSSKDSSSTTGTVKGTIGPSTVTEENSTTRFAAPGKGANSMGMECTPGKGANFTATECTMGNSTEGSEGASDGTGTVGPSTVTEESCIILSEEIFDIDGEYSIGGWLLENKLYNNINYYLLHNNINGKNNINGNSLNNDKLLVNSINSINFGKKSYNPINLYNENLYNESLYKIFENLDYKEYVKKMMRKLNKKIDIEKIISIEELIKVINCYIEILDSNIIYRKIMKKDNYPLYILTRELKESEENLLLETLDELNLKDKFVYNSFQFLFSNNLNFYTRAKKFILTSIELGKINIIKTFTHVLTYKKFYILLYICYEFLGTVLGHTDRSTVVPGSSSTVVPGTGKDTVGASTVTEGKGANFMGMECTSEKNNNEIAVVTNSRESSTFVDIVDSKGVGEGIGAVGPSTVTGTVTEKKIYNNYFKLIIIILMGQLYDNLGLYNEALEVVNKGFEITLTSIDLLCLRGKIYKHLCQYLNSFNDYNLASELDKSDRQISVKCSKAFIRINNFKLAHLKWKSFLIEDINNKFNNLNNINKENINEKENIKENVKEIENNIEIPSFKFLIMIYLQKYFLILINRINSLTVLGPTENSTTGKRANDTFGTPGKGANSTAMECTTGKGANSTLMECTSEKNSNEIAVVTKSGESGTFSVDTNTRGLGTGTEDGEGTSGTVGASTVTEESLIEIYLGYKEILEKHLEIYTNQLDFHNYCLNRLSYRIYYNFLKLKNNFCTHYYFLKSFKNIIKIVLELVSHVTVPVTVLGQTDTNSTNCSTSEKNSNKVAAVTKTRESGTNSNTENGEDTNTNEVPYGDKEVPFGDAVGASTVMEKYKDEINYCIEWMKIVLGLRVYYPGLYALFYKLANITNMNILFKLQCIMRCYYSSKCNPFNHHLIQLISHLLVQLQFSIQSRQSGQSGQSGQCGQSTGQCGQSTGQSGQSTLSTGLTVHTIGLNLTEFEKNLIIKVLKICIPYESLINKIIHTINTVTVSGSTANSSTSTKDIKDISSTTGTVGASTVMNNWSREYIDNIKEYIINMRYDYKGLKGLVMTSYNDREVEYLEDIFMDFKRIYEGIHYNDYIKIQKFLMEVICTCHKSQNQQFLITQLQLLQSQYTKR
uniref:Tetratricopeptide repeat/NMDA receptor-regulated protein 1, putative n=1 Tax=Theileria annulata TaxID=5874 RepID=A0A3B0N2T7_THEAN